MMRWQFLIDASPTALAPPFSPKMLSYSMVSMLAAGLSVLVSWPQNDLITHILLSNKPSVFFNTSIVVLLANAYVNLCTGRGEVVESTVPDKLALKDVVTLEEQFSFISYTSVAFILNALLYLLFHLPIMILAAGLSQVPAPIFARTWLIIFILCFFIFLRTVNAAHLIGELMLGAVQLVTTS